MVARPSEDEFHAQLRAEGIEITTSEVNGLFPSPPRAYGGTAATRNDVRCECRHAAHDHEGDEYGFCLACDCNHYRPTIKSAYNH